MRRRSKVIFALALALGALLAALAFQLSGPREAIGLDGLVVVGPRAEGERTASAAAIDAEPRSEVGERRELSVLVRDVEGADLEGAALIASASGGDVRLGTTDANGRLRATLPAAHGPRVRVERAGFRTALLALPPIRSTRC